MVKLLAFLLIAMPWGCGSRLGAAFKAAKGAQTASAPQQNPAVIHDDPVSIIHHCGQPDHVKDSVFVQPGNSITSRSLTYNKAHLTLTYVSSAPDDPQQWGFSGLVDTATNHALDARDLHGILEQRLPCAVRTNSQIAQSAVHSRENGRRAADKKQPIGD